MKHLKYILISAIAFYTLNINAQETNSDDYIEFDDSKNVVHGVYLGLNFSYGTIDSKSTYFGGAKIAYVANQQFEIGFAGVGFYSDQNENGPLDNNDLAGGYGGLHLEPIFFGKSMFSLAVPILIGGGAVGIATNDYDFGGDWEWEDSDNWEPVFVFEPGLSLQYNISRYLQVELGAKYRWSSAIDLYPGSVKNINGFSAGIGVKVGVFNMGRKNK